MLELLQILAALIALLAVACVAFVRPEGAIWKCAAAGAITALGAGVLWRLAATTEEAGGLSQWMAAFLVGLVAAVLAAFGAGLRHALNALGARALR